MTPALVVFALVLHLAGASVPDRFVEPHRAYASEAACEHRKQFYIAFARVDGEFKCQPLEVTQ